MSLDLSDLAVEAAPRDAEAIAAESFVVELEGFEGPLDMLLAMARTQKVDLAKISVLALAEQYLAFVAEAERLRIELAADYLVMAAWLAWLKSRLLLPEPEEAEGATGAEMAARLAFQLERLDAMRRVAAELMARDRLGQDVFARGAPEPLSVVRHVRWEASLADLLKAYARTRTRAEYRPLQMERPDIYPLEAALARLRAMLGAAPDWAELSTWLPETAPEPAARRSAVASCFAAALEMAKAGEIEIAQDAAFAPIRLRAREAEDA